MCIQPTILSLALSCPSSQIVSSLCVLPHSSTVPKRAPPHSPPHAPQSSPITHHTPPHSPHLFTPFHTLSNLFAPLLAPSHPITTYHTLTTPHHPTTYHPGTQYQDLLARAKDKAKEAAAAKEKDGKGGRRGGVGGGGGGGMGGGMVMEGFGGGGMGAEDGMYVMGPSMPGMGGGGGGYDTSDSDAEDASESKAREGMTVEEQEAADLAAALATEEEELGLNAAPEDAYV